MRYLKVLFSPFFLIFTTITGFAYYYAARELTNNVVTAVLLALPFLGIWLMPVVVWSNDREMKSKGAEFFQYFAFLSMGWLNFLFVALIPLNLISLGLHLAGQAQAETALDRWTPPLTIILSLLMLGLAFHRARRGPAVKEVVVELNDLPPEFEGFRIVQISDLHIGPTIHKPYVERVTQLTADAKPDLVVLTGDIVDGKSAALLPHAAPLREMSRKFPSYLILGNHEYYTDVDVWIPEFKAMGITVLENSHIILKRGEATLLLAGVLDPAVASVSKTRRPDPAEARGLPELSEGFLRIVLAHNPKLAPACAAAGFHLQLSGHTHAGQFIPWNWVTKMVHDPHYAGLSKQDNMWVYVSAGTGSWGPPFRLGTSLELTLLILKRKTSV